MSDLVLSEQRDSIRILTLNRPDRLNAINAGLVTDFREALAAANSDDATRVIILRGAGRAFCTGNDLKETAGFLASEHDAASVEAYGHELQDISRLIVDSDRIVIGAIHGWAVGAAFEWAINCDFTVWAEGSRAFFPEVGWGMFSTGGVTTLLPRIVGINKAREMLLLGDKHDAAELHALGIAWKVVPDAHVLDSALDLAQRIVDLPRTTVGRFKTTYNRAAFMDLEGALRAEVQALTESLMDAETGDRVHGRKI
jgi:enoyl-CoA hydratase/carnithine racemase